MVGRNSIIMIVNDSPDEARNIKELIEFMDVPQVLTSTPSNWRSRLGDQRLDAIFVGPQVTDSDIRSVFGAIGEYNPNVPVVVIGPAGSA